MSPRDLPHETVLPQLAKILDLDFMARIFADHCLRDPGVIDVEHGAITHVKYKPGRNCLICYQLRLRDRTTGEAWEQRLCGRVYQANGALSRYRKASAGPVTALPRIRSVAHVPELEMVVWAFPNDRKLTALPLVTDRTELDRSLLEPVIEAALGSGWKPAGFDHAIVHYVPEHTCCIRVAAICRHPACSDERALTVYGKTYYDDQGARTWQVMRQLRAARDPRNGLLITPQPLAYDAGHRLLWQEGLPGKILADGVPSLALFAATGAALASLHKTTIIGARQLTTRDMAPGLHTVASMLAATCPGLADAVAPVFSRAADKAQALPADVTATLHGDCHAQNFLVSGDRIALIDLDNVMVGPPLHDVGSFIAALLHRACLDRTPLADMWPFINAFLVSYRAAVTWPVGGDDVAWYTAAALLQERARRAVTRLKPGRLALIGKLITLADRLAVEGLGVLSNA